MADSEVAASYVIHVFPGLATRATGEENPTFYSICPELAVGDRGLGFGKVCPRDGQANCSIVDSLEEEKLGSNSQMPVHRKLDPKAWVDILAGPFS